MTSPPPTNIFSLEVLLHSNPQPISSASLPEMATATLCSLPVELIGNIMKSCSPLHAGALTKNQNLKNVRLVCRELNAKTLIYFGDEFLTSVTVNAATHCFHEMAEIAQHPVLCKSVRKLGVDWATTRSHSSHAQPNLDCCGHVSDSYFMQGFNHDLAWCLKRVPNIDTVAISLSCDQTCEFFCFAIIDSIYSAVLNYNIHLGCLYVRNVLGFPFEHKDRQLFRVFDKLKEIRFDGLTLLCSPLAFNEMIHHAKGLQRLTLSFGALDFSGDLFATLCEVDLRSRPLQTLSLSNMSICGSILAKFLGVCPDCMARVKLSHITLSSGKWKDSFEALKTLGKTSFVNFCTLKEEHNYISFEEIHRQRPIIEQDLYDGDYFLDKYDPAISPPRESDERYQGLDPAERELAAIDYEIHWGYEFVGIFPTPHVLQLSADEAYDVNYWLSQVAEHYTLV